MMSFPISLDSEAAAGRLWQTLRAAWNDGRLLFAASVIVGLSWEAHAVFVPSNPVRAAGTKAFVVEDFGAGIPVGQTFRMNRNGLASTRLQFFANRPTDVAVRCKLLTWGGYAKWVSVYEWTERINLPAGRTWHRFQFNPVVPSEQLIYQFQVQKIDSQPHGAETGTSQPALGLMGSKDDSLREGNIVDGSEQIVDQDLLFEAQADDSAFSIFRRNVNSNLPKPLRSKFLQLTILAMYNAALAVYLHYMLVSGPRGD